MPAVGELLPDTDTVTVHRLESTAVLGDRRLSGFRTAIGRSLDADSSEDRWLS
jgi:hypothetical protein